MPLALIQDHVDCMRRHAEQAYPQEGCGLLLGHLDAETSQKTLVSVALMTNDWSPQVAQQLEISNEQAPAAENLSSARRYWIDPRQLLETQRQARSQGLSIIGVYHSHPDAAAVPSGCDRDLAWQTYSYIIVSVQRGVAADIQSWQLNPEHQFESEPMKIVPASAARDRMPFLSS